MGTLASLIAHLSLTQGWFLFPSLPEETPFAYGYLVRASAKARVSRSPSGWVVARRARRGGSHARAPRLVLSGASSAALTRGDAGSRTESTPSSGSRPRAGGPRRALAHAPLRPVVARARCWEGIRCCFRGRRPARRRWALARAPRWRAGTSPARSRWATAGTRRRCVRGRAMDAAPFSRVRPGGTGRFHLENPFGGWRRLPRGLGPRAAPPRGHPHPPPREPSIANPPSPPPAPRR